MVLIYLFSIFLQKKNRGFYWILRENYRKNKNLVYFRASFYKFSYFDLC